MTDDVRALARLLPDPARHEPPEGRLHRLRETFMEQITSGEADIQDREMTLAAPATPPRPRRRRRLVPALVGGGLAFVMVLWLTSAFLLGVGKFWAGRTEAGDLLHRIALVAANSTDIPPLDQIRDDQFIYFETYEGWGGYGLIGSDRDGPIGWYPPQTQQRQVWLSVDGSRPGLLREGPAGHDVRIDPTLNPDLHRPTLRYLATLPTDPDLLLLKIYWKLGVKGPNPDRAFATIIDLIIQPIVPPDLATALYQAAARIPGIEVVHDVKDALGRPGIAIARTDAGLRREVIFDRQTLQFLGYRVLVTPDAKDPFGPGTTPPSPEGFEQTPEGFVLGSTAVVARAIVDAPGQLPTDRADQPR
ncbi:MAG: CU044_5270 family protein [Micromonosporaceae bacterium]|nr:CU044_5270 family protein [Micromonosporaceae bacterium]